MCKNLIGVHLAQPTIQACSERLASAPHAHFFPNADKSLSIVADISAAFVFRVDSPADGEADAIEAYPEQLKNKTGPNAIGFVHHSSIRRYQLALSAIEAIPDDLRDEVIGQPQP